MLKHHLPHLFDDDPNQRAVADAMGGRVYELVSFLTDVLGISDTGAAPFNGTVTYHDSCSGLRELGIKQQPRDLLAAAKVTVVEMTEPEICCGFGGTFCVKYPEISVRMASDKTRDIAATGAGTVLAGDLGCLLNIDGRLSREGSPVRARHVAEVLAGITAEVAPIGQPRQKP
jgi:L-lactate dehydrogenase complex protein LldE